MSRRFAIKKIGSLDKSQRKDLKNLSKLPKNFKIFLKSLTEIGSQAAIESENFSEKVSKNEFLNFTKIPAQDKNSMGEDTIENSETRGELDAPKYSHLIRNRKRMSGKSE